MSKKKKQLVSIIGIAVLVLLLVATVPLLMNLDDFLGEDSDDNIDSSQKDPDNVGGNVVEGGNQDERSLFVKYNDVVLVSNETLEVFDSNVTFTIEAPDTFEASFVIVPDTKKWSYKVGDTNYQFVPDLSVLQSSIEGNKASIAFPFNIVDWLLLQHVGVSIEEFSLPTNVNNNVAYIALEVKMDDEYFYCPIKFNLNGGWTKVYLDKDEIIFCD